MITKRVLHALLSLAIGGSAALDLVHVAHLIKLQLVYVKDGHYHVSEKGQKAIEAAISALAGPDGFYNLSEDTK